MALEYATGTFRFLTTDSIGTTKTLVPGFEAKAMIFAWAGRGDTTDTIGRATTRRGFGFCSGTAAEVSVSATSVDAAAAGDGASSKRVDAAVHTVDAAGTVDGRANVSSITSTDIVLTVDDVFPVDLTVTWQAWGGTAITNAQAAEVSTPAATGAQSQTISSVGFQGTIGFWAACDLLTNGNATDATIIQIMFGAATSSSDEHVWWGGTDEASVSADTGGYCLAGEMYAMAPGTINSAGAVINSRAEFTQWETNGYTLNWIEHGRANRDMMHLIIAGGNWTVGDFVTVTTPGTIVESGLGYDPNGVMVISAGRAASTADNITIDDRLTFGAASGASNESCQAMLDEDGPANMEVTTAVDFNAVYVNIDTASAVEGEIELQSLDTGGFTLNQGNADASAYFAWYVAFGNPAAGGASSPYYSSYYTRLVAA